MMATEGDCIRIAWVAQSVTDLVQAAFSDQLGVYLAHRVRLVKGRHTKDKEHSELVASLQI